MPTILRLDGHRFFFYSWEGSPREPPHIHVEHGDKVAKFWLDPVELADNDGFRSKELNRLRVMVIEHRQLFLEAWHGYFSDQT